MNRNKFIFNIEWHKKENFSLRDETDQEKI